MIGYQDMQLKVCMFEVKRGGSRRQDFSTVLRKKNRQSGKCKIRVNGEALTHILKKPAAFGKRVPMKLIEGQVRLKQKARRSNA